MNDATTFDPTAENRINYKTSVVECIKKIDVVRQQMAEDQKEIDRLKAETREILERLEAA